MTGLPPYAALLGAAFDPETVEPVVVMPFAPVVLGRPGFVHGGALAGLMEVAATAALRRALDAEGGGTIDPITVTVDFMRGGRERPTRALGVVTRLGTRVANVVATAWQDDRARPIAAARLNYLVARD